MNILLTNDDGYNSLGINILKSKLSKYGSVTIVAPESHMSGKSVSIIYGRAVNVTKVSEDVYAMEGTPADCVAFGLSSLNKKFDLVISGCNAGLNLSWDVLYSGTIGACLESLMYRIPAVAFSTREEHFQIVENHFDEVMNYILENKLLSSEYILNVNFPISDESKGIKITNVHYRGDGENTYYVKQADGLYYALRDIKDEKCEDKDSDVYAIYNSYISISKLNKII